MIFYFSATGNCLDVAQRLAAALDEKLYDVAALNKKGKYSFEKSHGESVGLVIPVYYGGIPLPVSEFLGKFSCGNDLPYVYAVFTYGGSIGGADYRLKKLLDKVNIPLHAVYGVKCPDNFLPLFNPEDEETCKKILSSAHSETEKIAEKILSRQHTSLLSSAVGRIYSFFSYPLCLRGRKTSPFYATDACLKCGLCEKICPENALSLASGKPRWTKDKCALCLGCINRCPVKAIQYGKVTEKRRRYVNPVLTGGPTKD